ncbi:hypothetical protein [Lacticaseibacillus rhamnosus]|nr:hypothetical protein [Lacticaseibacillus rhamnosus]
MNKRLAVTVTVLAGLMFEAAKQAIKDAQDYSDQTVKSVSAK